MKIQIYLQLCAVFNNYPVPLNVCTFAPEFDPKVYISTVAAVSRNRVSTVRAQSWVPTSVKIVGSVGRIEEQHLTQSLVNTFAGVVCCSEQRVLPLDITLGREDACYVETSKRFRSRAHVHNNVLTHMTSQYGRSLVRCMTVTRGFVVVST